MLDDTFVDLSQIVPVDLCGVGIRAAKFPGMNYNTKLGGDGWCVKLS